jgi:hypothetical protein
VRVSDFAVVKGVHGSDEGTAVVLVPKGCDLFLVVVSLPAVLPRTLLLIGWLLLPLLKLLNLLVQIVDGELHNVEVC